MGAIDLHARGQLFLRALVLFDVALERFGLFNCVEVLPLDVFNDGHFQHPLRSRFFHHYWDYFETGQFGSSPTTFTSNDLITSWSFSYHQRLQNTVFTN